jgi:hypothetical protein
MSVCERRRLQANFRFGFPGEHSRGHEKVPRSVKSEFILKHDQKSDIRETTRGNTNNSISTPLNSSQTTIRRAVGLAGA